MFKVVNIDQTFFDNLSKTRFAGSPFPAHRRLVLRPAELFHIRDRSSVLSYKSAFVLVHKLREAMAEELKGRVVGGEGKQTEADGGYFGGYVKPSNQTEYRRDRRLARNQNGKRKVVVVIRERGGNSVPAVFNTESQAASFIHGRIAKGTIVHADEAAPWDNLHERFEVKRINHQETYSLNGACTNMAEEYFPRLRRAEIGIHHHITGAYLQRYAQESSWREDNSRASNGDQVNRIAALTLKRGKVLGLHRVLATPRSVCMIASPWEGKMSIADSLFREAQAIAAHFQGTASNLEREILDLETQLQKKKAALHTARMASKRARNFRPMFGADFYCPGCWVEKEENATLRPIPGDAMRCNVCDRLFAI